MSTTELEQSVTPAMENSNIEDEEALMFHSYACAYYVQSPSTISHANSSSADMIRHHSTHLESFHSPTPSETTFILNKNAAAIDVARSTLSRYSSSRGSNNSFLHHDDQKKQQIVVADSGGAGRVNRLIIIDPSAHGLGGCNVEEEDYDEEEEEEEGYYEGKRRGWWWRYCSFRRSNSCAWISLQIFWRLLLSLAVALLVFYIATKPPAPKISIKAAGVPEFGLGEGVDGSGVATKILTCNSSIHLLIDNKSKLFGLHIHPPIIDISFGRLPLAMSHGPKLYARASGSSIFELYIGTRNKPMYGAGRSMQDLLESGMGLPLVIRLKLSSNFRVVWNLIRPTFHHKAECLLVLDGKYDKKHRTQKYNSTCTIIAS